MIRHMMLFKGIVKRIMTLSDRYGQNCLFISQFDEGDVDDSAVVILLTKTEEDDYMKVRRLLKSLQHKINGGTDVSVSFELKRKEARE